jgi:iron complex outermembrane receptor protein
VKKSVLRASAAWQVVALLGAGVGSAFVAAAPAAAQSAADQGAAVPTPGAQASQDPNAATPSASAKAAASPSGGEIIVTGTLIRRVKTDTVSPITTISSTVLAQRGVNTVTQALQTLTNNNAGTIPNAWNAGGSNFAGGGSGVSLRGLTSSYTLVLFDGMRAATYPYGDDGARSFVDTNTIPNFLVDRIEVLRDGASSTYGTDAIAGVVNIITKKQITGIHGDASYGISQRGEGREKKAALTVGVGDYASSGFNIYVGGEYQSNDELLARNTFYPFNTADLSHLCGKSIGGGVDGFGNDVPAGANTCVVNGVSNGINADGSFTGGTDGFGATRVPFVAPIALPTNGSLVGSRNAPTLGAYQMLNPALGCQGLPSITLSAAQAAQEGVAGQAPVNGNVCQEDFTKEYLQLHAKQKRYGLSTRASIRVSDSAEAYIMGNWYHNDTFGSGGPFSTRGSGFRTAAGGTQVDLRGLVLPAYVCPITTVGICDATNGSLNPNNPFAAQGLGARLLFTAPIVHGTRSVVNTYRVAAGLAGDFGPKTHYNLDATWMDIDARTISTGAYNIRHLLNVVRDGSLNLVDFSKNSQALLDYVFPTVDVASYSRMYQLQGSVSHTLATLPGGDLAVAVGASYRKESLDWRSSNPPNISDPADRYDRSVNGVGAKGSRNVKSVYAELNAPILDIFEVDVAGRYDKYSSGQKAFSPKFGAKFKPFRQLTLRGTWSKGFRVPSFNEAFGLPTTGYVGDTVTAARAGGQAYLDAHGNNAYATNAYTYGLTSTGNPSLKPEKTTNVTLGAIFQPIRPLTLTVDFYDIKIKNLVSAPSTSAVLGAYYGNNGVVNIPGITVLPSSVDPAHPTALPRLDEIQYSYVNVGSFKTRGIDFSAELRMNLGGVRWTSYAEATRILRLRASNQDYDYVGTLSPCNVTSCSGAPKWKGSWQNTFEYGPLTVSGTAYYVSGYDEASVDFGGIPGDCLGSLGASVGVYNDQATPSLCRQKSFITADLVVSYKVSPKLTIYGNVLNVFDRKPPYDPGSAYGITSYNPAFHDAGILGRYFRIGAKVDLGWKQHAPVAYAPPPMQPVVEAPATQTCADGTVILATAACPVAAPPPPPPPPSKGERG